MLCGLCFPADGHLVACTCCCVWAQWVTAEVHLSRFFPTSLFFVPFTFLSIFIYLFFIILFIHSNSCFFFSFIAFTLYFTLSFSISLRRSELLQKFFCYWLRLGGFEGCGVAAKTWILSKFLPMTPSLLFTSSGSFLVFRFIIDCLVWSSNGKEGTIENFPIWKHSSSTVCCVAAHPTSHESLASPTKLSHQDRQHY